MIFAALLEIVFSILIILFFYTQVIRPALLGQKLFPFFDKKRSAAIDASEKRATNDEISGIRNKR